MITDDDVLAYVRDHPMVSDKDIARAYAVRVYDIGDEDDEPLLVLFPGRDIPGVE